MKKTVALILCLLMALSCACLPACGSGAKKDLSGSKYIGFWKAVSLSVKDKAGEFEEEITLTLKGNGTAEFASGDEVTACTWEETKDGFKLKDGAKMTFKDDGDGITSSVFGVQLHFERLQ